MIEVPRGITARRLIRALQSDGFQLMRTRGIHRIYRHANGRRVVVAYHSLGSGFPVGTLRGIISDTGWAEDDLRRLGLLR